MVPMTLVSNIWLCFSKYYLAVFQLWYMEIEVIQTLVVYFSAAPFGADIASLQVDIEAQTDVRLHVKITDPNNKRWEIPAE